MVGLAAEARLARGLAAQVEIGGGEPDGATAAAQRLVRSGVSALISFGLAGGLAPRLTAGLLVIPLDLIAETGQTWRCDPALAARFGLQHGSMLAGDAILTTALAKTAAYQRHGALAVDLESGAVARIAAAHNIPFAILRAICDPADRDLPPAALTALHPDGRIKPGALLQSLARHPRQIPALIVLGRDAARARKALLAAVASAGPLN